MLTEIFEALSAEFAKLMPGVEWKDGSEHLGANSAPPRVVWIPKDDAFQAPEVHLDDATSYALPRPLAMVESTVLLHLWGKDRAQTEAMRDAMVNAIRTSVLAAARISFGEWVQQDAQPLVQAGRIYVLTVAFKQLILESAGGVATVTTTTQDVATWSVP